MRTMMRCIVIVFVALFILPYRVRAEQIQSFEVDIDIKSDGTFAVEETLVYDFESQQRHGIYRIIPRVKTNAEGDRFVIGIDTTNVLVDQEVAMVEESIDSQEISYKIGDPHQTITGVHVYSISYSVTGGIAYYSDHDELYWNITGDEWDVPIDNAVAYVEFPQELPDENVRLTCYTGRSGSTNRDCLASYENGVAAFQLDREALGAREGMSIVVAFPKGVVAEVFPEKVFEDTYWGKMLKVLIRTILISLAVLWYGIAPFYIIYRWWKYGRDPEPTMGVVSAWFEPPQGKNRRPLTPAETGTLIDEEASTKDIIGSVIDLARRGYVTIEEPKKKDFYLTRTGKSFGSGLQPFEQILLEGIFRSKDSVRLKSAKLVSVVERVKKALYTSMVREGYFPTDPQKQRSVYSAIGVLALFTGNFFLGIISFIFGRAMPVKTLFGVEQAAVATSLRNFLKSQERQLEYQSKNQLFFEKLLPFAVAFGVEKIWAKRFADIDMKPPDWYQSSVTKTFTAESLAQDMSKSVSSFTHAATPTSSSSGFSSGFSGGSSGGGGGGGGGGSW